MEVTVIACLQAFGSWDNLSRPDGKTYVFRILLKWKYTE